MKKAGWLDTVKHVFVEDVEDTSTKNTSNGITSTNPVSTVLSSPIVVDTQTSNISTVGTIDKKFADYFADLLSKADLPGPDYYEFSQALQSMSDSGMPEANIFKVAWKTFTTAMGGSKDPNALIVAGKHYLQMLELDKTDFMKRFDEKKSEQVGVLETKLQSLNQEAVNAAAEIEKLQKKISDNNTLIAQTKGDIAQQTTKLETNKSNYVATLQVFSGKIESDLAKIPQYIQV